MKVLMFTIVLAALTAGMATAGGGYGYGYQGCANNNSRACRDARDAFARHHGGNYPRQYQNHAYNNGGRYWNDGEGERHHERHERHEHHEHHDHD